VATRVLTPRDSVFGGLSASAEAVLPYALGFLTAAGITELLLLRTLSRVAVHIPKEGLVLHVYQGLTGVGSFAFDLATVLAVATLTFALYTLVRREHRLDGWRALVLGALALLLAWSVLPPLLRAAGGSTSGRGGNDALKLAFGLAFSLAVIGLALPYALSRRATAARRIAVGLVAAAYLCGQYYAVSYAATGLLSAGGPPALASQVLTLGEVLVVVSAGAIFVAWGTGTKRGGKSRARLRLAIPTALSLLLLAGYLANGSTSAILSLWTEGLTLYLPFPLYLTAFWLFGWAVLASFQRRDGFTAGCALLLLFVGGYALELTYQHVLAAIALVVLTWPEPVTQEPEGIPSALQEPQSCAGGLR
jgi:hypothetical protein